MGWNYRVIRHHDPNNDEPDYLSIHEVYYDDEGRPERVTEQPTGAGAETVEGLREVFGLMRQALDKPILDFETFSS